MFAIDLSVLLFGENKTSELISYIYCLKTIIVDSDNTCVVHIEGNWKYQNFKAFNQTSVKQLLLDVIGFFLD